MSHNRKKINPAKGPGTPRGISHSKQLLERLLIELRVEMQKQSDHLQQLSPRHQLAFAASHNHLESVEIHLCSAIDYLEKEQ